MLATAIIRTRNNRCSIAWILAVTSMTIDGLNRPRTPRPVKARATIPRTAVGSDCQPKSAGSEWTHGFRLLAGNRRGHLGGVIGSTGAGAFGIGLARCHIHRAHATAFSLGAPRSRGWLVTDAATL